MNKIANYQPLANELVEIKTNWTTYLVRLQKSVFGGYEFHVSNSDHVVQLSTVTSWNFANN